MGRVSRWATVVPCALIGAASALVFAPDAMAADTESRVVEEIIVTSRREAESQQSVPIAVSVLGSRDLERIQPNTLKDIDGFMPNVFIGRQTAGPNMGAIFIRGLGYQDVEKNVPPAVGVIIDELVVGTNTGQLIDMFDVEQVEVNRGPQGVLFGKNTTGGTIVVRRVEPHLDGWGGAASIQMGDYDERQLKGRINVPLIPDQLALKIGAIKKEQEGFYDNLTLGGDEGAGDYLAYTSALLWEPSESLRAKLSFDRLHDNSDSVAMDPRYNGDNPFKNENDWRAQTEYDQDMWGLVVDFDLGGATLTSITGYIDGNDIVEQDFDSSSVASVATGPSGPFAPQPLAQLHTLRDGSYEQFSQELRLTGEFTDTLRYTIGGYYMDSTIKLNQLTNAIAQLENFTIAITPTCAEFGDFVTGVVPGFIVPHPVLGNAFCQTPYLPTPGGPLGDNSAFLGFAEQTAQEDVTSQAVFGALRWQATDALELAGGVRWLKDEKDFENNFVSVAPPPPDDFPVSDDHSWDDVVFELSASYQLTDRNMVYARYAEGFRSGGYAIRANDVDQITYEPEDVTSYEIGSKNDFFDNRVRLNLTAFYTEMDDYQYGVVIQDPLEAPSTTTPINNAKELEVKGFEMDAVLALVDHFTLIATLGIQDGERKAYVEDPTRLPIGPNGTAGSPADCPTGCLLPKIDLPRTPDWNWALTGIFDWTVDRFNFEASASARATDDILIVGSNLLTGDVDPSLVQDGYTLIDARLAMNWSTANGDTLQLAVWGKNLTDEEYKDFILPLGATGGFQGWGPPRTWAVEFRWSR
jgi:iron complex outermembrane receptor protein